MVRDKLRGQLCQARLAGGARKRQLVCLSCLCLLQPQSQLSRAVCGVSYKLSHLPLFLTVV